MKTPADRIRKALEGHTAGCGQVVAVVAGDTLAVAKAVHDPDPVVKSLLKGSAAVRPDGVVYQRVDDLLLLLSAVGG